MPVIPLALNWAVRLTGVIAVVAVVRDRFGTPACFAAMIGMFVSGFLPPIFPLMYKAYTTRAFGFRVRHMLHPRLPAHSTTVFGARRIVSGTDASKHGLLLVPVSVLADNYSYIIGCERTRTCAVVDPADPQRIVDVVRALGFEIKLVLTTHKHWDHAGGNDELRAMLPADANVRFVGSEEDAPAACDLLIHDGAVMRFGDAEVQAHATPGHTTGHLVYRVRHGPKDGAVTPKDFSPLTHAMLAAIEPLFAATASGALATVSAKDPRVNGLADRLKVPLRTHCDTSALFTGDCIFCGGCGAMFECRAATDVLLTYDLLHRMHALAPKTLCFVGHEYTERLFAELAERYPANADLKRRFTDVRQRRQRLDCTVPSTLADEAATNPLMTLDREELVRMAAACAGASEVENAVYVSTKRRKPNGKAIDGSP